MKNNEENVQLQKSSNQQIDVAIRIGLIALLAFWSLYIAAPFVVPVIWGIIIAVGSYPVHQLLQSKLGLSNALSATLYSFLLLALLITPTVILSGELIDEAQELSTQVKQDKLTIPPPPTSVKGWPLVGEKISAFWTRASEDPKETVRKIRPELEKIGKWLISTAAGAGFTILMFSFSIIIAGVFLATAAKGRQAAEAILTRLVGENGKNMTDLAQATVRSVVNGILGIAILQAILAGLGFMAMDIPWAGALALLCLVLAVVQIDILIILIPLSIYAFSTTGTFAAVVFLIWNIAVGLMNNVLKPILLGRGVKAPMAVIFIGAIGGMIAHGIIGLFIGAVVFVLGYTLFMVWLDEAETKDSKSTTE
ncbi:MAG: AI-2E family transporter [Thiohalomonadales bacterium]